MRRKLFLIGLLVWNLSFIYGQNCGTPIPDSNKTKNYVDKSTLNFKNQYFSFCIDVQFHIVRETNGTNAFNPQNTNSIIADLNANFNNHNIYFNNIGTNYIDNSNYVNIDSDTEAENLANQNNNPNALNYYIVETLWNVNGGFVTGTAIDIPSINLVIRNDRTLTSTSPHEVGHCIDLYHTHETAFGVEQINGSNCTLAGDLVCDTPADPRLGFNNVNINCDYVGGGGYNPLTDNIMSYSPNFCRDKFSENQAVRMYVALNNNPILQNIVSNNCTVPKITGDTTICYGSNITYTLTNGGSNVTWQVSPNFQVISSNNASITITPTSSNIREEGFLKAVLANQTIEKYVWIGKPDAYTMDSNGIKNYMGGSFNFQPQPSARGQFSVFSDAPNVTYNWSGPNNVGWWQINRNTIEIDISFSGSYVFTSEFSNECGTHYYFVFVNIGGITPDFRISPNPASESFTISKKSSNDSSKSDINSSTYELFDMNSNMKLKSSFLNSKNVNVYHLKKGLYILKIVTDNKVEHHRIIIK